MTGLDERHVIDDLIAARAERRVRSEHRKAARAIGVNALDQRRDLSDTRARRTLAAELHRGGIGVDHRAAHRWGLGDVRGVRGGLPLLLGSGLPRWAGACGRQAVAFLLRGRAGGADAFFAGALCVLAAAGRAFAVVRVGGAGLALDFEGVLLMLAIVAPARASV